MKGGAVYTDTASGKVKSSLVMKGGAIYTDTASGKVSTTETFVLFCSFVGYI